MTRRLLPVMMVLMLMTVAWWFGSDRTAEPAGPVVPPPVAVDPAAPVVPLVVGVVVGTLPISGYFYGYSGWLVDGAVWIPASGRVRDEHGYDAYRIDVTTREVTDRVEVGRIPLFPFTANGAIWVPDKFDGTVRRIDPVSFEVTDTIPVGTEIASAVIARGALWIAVDGRLVRLDLARRAVTDSYPLPVPSPFGWMISTDDAIWGHDAEGREGLHRFDLSSREFTDDVYVGQGHMTGSPAIFAAGGIWIAGHEGESVRLDLETLDVTRFEADSSQPLFAHGAVWMSARENDNILRIDPVSLEVTDVIDVGRSPGEPVAHAGAIWVPNLLDGTVSQIDPGTREAVDTIAAGVGQFSALVATPDALWVLGDRITIIATP